LEKVNLQTSHIVTILDSFMPAAVPQNVTAPFCNGGIRLAIEGDRTMRCSMATHIPDAELSQLFDQSGGWVQGITARYLHQLFSDNSLTRNWRRLVESQREKKLVQFCLRRQVEKRPAAIKDLIDFMRGSGGSADRVWVHHFVGHNAAMLCLRQATFLKEIPVASLRTAHNVISTASRATCEPLL
jgi:hypothetical protein